MLAPYNWVTFQTRPFETGQNLFLENEFLDPPIQNLSNIDFVSRTDGYVVCQTELAGALTRFAERSNDFPLKGQLKYAVIYSIGHKEKVFLRDAKAVGSADVGPFFNKVSL